MKGCLTILANKLENTVILWFYGISVPTAGKLKVYSLDHTVVDCITVAEVMSLCCDGLQELAFLQPLFYAIGAFVACRIK